MAFGNIAPFMALGPEQLGRTLLQKNVPPANYDPFANVVTVPQKPSNAMPMPYPSTTEARPLFDPFANTTITNSAVNQTPQPSGKQVRLPSGKIVTFPPNVPDDQILRDAIQLDQVDQDVNAFENQHPLAKGLQQLLGPQFGFQPPQPAEYKIPVVPGNTFGMTPQTLNNTLGIIQNTQNSNAAERIRQRVQIEQEMEREKDRAQQLKLEQQRLKNQQMMEKMRMQQEEQQLRAQGETRLEQERIKAQSTAERDKTRFEQQIALKEMELSRPMVVGNRSVVFDPQSGQFLNASSGEVEPNLQRVQTDQGVYVFDQNNPTQPAVRVEGIEGNIGRGTAGGGSAMRFEAAWRMATQQAQSEVQGMAAERPDLLVRDPETLKFIGYSPEAQRMIMSRANQYAQQFMAGGPIGGGNSGNRQSTLTPREDGVLELTFP